MKELVVSAVIFQSTVFSRALMYLHHYWLCAVISDGKILWKTSSMKIWCKRETWEIGTPVELRPNN